MESSQGGASIAEGVPPESGQGPARHVVPVKSASVMGTMEKKDEEQLEYTAYMVQCTGHDGVVSTV